MSKNRNQPPQQRPVTQQPPAQEQQSQEGQQQQGQEDQAQQEQAPQDSAGTEQQQSNDQAAGDQAEQAKEVAPPPVQEKEVVKTPAPAVKTQQEGFTPVMKVQRDLVNYAEAMDNKKSIVPEEGGKWQYSLFSTIKEVLNAKDQEQFNREFNTALQFFHQNKDGIFNENFLFRFPEQWPGSSNEFTSFRRIVYVMIQTANAKTRKAELKHVNLELVVEGLSQAQRTKLLNFYEA